MSYEQEQKAALGQIVKPGDFVQFFISCGSQERKSYSANCRPLIVLGTVPSTIDALHHDPMPRPVEYDCDRFEIIQNQFGALSELGIGHRIIESVSFNNKTENLNSDSPIAQQTKIDVPFSVSYISIKTQESS